MALLGEEVAVPLHGLTFIKQGMLLPLTLGIAGITFLSRLKAALDIVTGDAILVLIRVRVEHFDVLLNVASAAILIV